MTRKHGESTENKIVTSAARSSGDVEVGEAWRCCTDLCDFCGRTVFPFSLPGHQPSQGTGECDVLEHDLYHHRQRHGQHHPDDPPTQCPERQRDQDH